jgi:putative hydrolase of the HAD superfamily
LSPAVAIRAVIFDFGGVLCFHPARELVRAAAVDCGIDPDKFAPALWRDRLSYDAGKVDAQKYWREVFESVGLPFNAARLPEFVAHEIGFWSSYDQRVLDWIGQLRSAGYRTGILSNLPRPLGENLRTVPGFLEHFDHVTFSYELLSAKPEPPIYHHAIEGAGVAAEETLFLDDRPENIAGAKDVGMQAELFETWEQFAADGPRRYALPLPSLP